MRLSVPHYRQTQPQSCLPACARVVLGYLGKNHSEAELAFAFRTVHWAGTLAENAIDGLEQMGYEVFWFHNADLTKLRLLLSQGWPVIVLLYASDLPHGREGIHAIVVIGIENDQVICLDPSLPNELILDLRQFAAIWAGLDNQGIVIWT
ncbi:MAG: C39 family peptidase [Caldilineaceae bacterium]|nr:C39 family peptidase [Caldilineaceae bacterium]